MAITTTINIPSSGAAGRVLNTVLNGALDPTNQGITGDFYLQTSSLTLFGPKTKTGWPTPGQSLIASGSGTGGNRFFWGNGPPSPDLGQSVNDAYFDRVNDTLYQAS